MSDVPTTLMVFVDGLGLGAPGPQNPIDSTRFPVLAAMLGNAVALDATMGVAGLPQSATGQTALLTGVNAAKVLGGHREGFPNAELRQIIANHNIFGRLQSRGYRCAFANAYYLRDTHARGRLRHRSVTTVATLSAIGWVRDEDYLERGEAVYQDITRELLRPRGYRGPLISEDRAAEHLVGIARKHDFTLFEYFQTDIAGHSGDMALACRVLGILDRFLGRVRELIKAAGGLLVVTSDHGNIEDMHSPAHTDNPVPLFAEGPGSGRLLARVRSLPDLVPALLELYPNRSPGIPV